MSATAAPRTLLVLGGNGFVGGHVCRAGVRAGLRVVSVNRSGRPDNNDEAWTNEVEWVAADVFDTCAWTPALKSSAANETDDTTTTATSTNTTNTTTTTSTTASSSGKKNSNNTATDASSADVVSCIGAIGSQTFMRRMCGEATAVAAEASAAAGARAFGFVSALRAGDSPDFPLSAVGRGYFEGKALAEAAVRQHFPTTHVILRPGVVYAKDSTMRTLAAAPMRIAEGILGTSLVQRIPILRHSTPAADADDIGAIFAAMAKDSNSHVVDEHEKKHPSFLFGTYTPEQLAECAKVANQELA